MSREFWQLESLPATYWLLCADDDTINALLWAAGEFVCRCPPDINKLDRNITNPRCQGGVSGMYEIVQRRRMKHGGEPVIGLSNYMHDPPHVPVRRVDWITKPHGVRTIDSMATLVAKIENDDFKKRVNSGKYTSGDYTARDIIAYAYCAGQLVKDEWQWPPSAHQKKYLDLMHRVVGYKGQYGFNQPPNPDGHTYKSLLDTAVKDFERALAVIDTA